MIEAVIFKHLCFRLRILPYCSSQLAELRMISRRTAFELYQGESNRQTAKLKFWLLLCFVLCCYKPRRRAPLFEKSFALTQLLHGTISTGHHRKCWHSIFEAAKLSHFVVKSCRRWTFLSQIMKKVVIPIVWRRFIYSTEIMLPPSIG